MGCESEVYQVGIYQNSVGTKEYLAVVMGCDALPDVVPGYALIEGEVYGFRPPAIVSGPSDPKFTKGSPRTITATNGFPRSVQLLEAALVGSQLLVDNQSTPVGGHLFRMDDNVKLKDVQKALKGL